MNALASLNALGFRGLNLLAAADAAPKANDKPPETPFFGPDGYIGWIQLICILALIGLIVFYFIYKKKQNED